MPADMFDQILAAHRQRTKAQAWSHSEEILALILERIEHLDNLTAWIWTDPKSRPSRFPKSFRYPRPFPPPKRQPSTIDEIKRFFGKGVRHRGR